MSPKLLAWEIVQQPDATVVSLTGAITEHADFQPLLGEIVGPSVIFDLSQIERINSSGVREWVNFMVALDSTSKPIIFKRCAVCVVHQLNMVSSFRGRGQVRSVMAPYYCEPCDKEQTQLIDLTGSQPAGIAEEVPCPTCGESMHFDDVPDYYLSFQTS